MMMRAALLDGKRCTDTGILLRWNTRWLALFLEEVYRAYPCAGCLGPGFAPAGL